MNTLPAILSDISRRYAPGQLERYHVERFKPVGGKWAWVTVGYFNAASKEEARAKGRTSMADRICVLRATAVGMAPEGVKL